MNSLIRLAILVSAALFTVGTAAVVIAQAGTGRPGPPMYDVKTETTIKGTVESVELIAGGGGGGRSAAGGTHLSLRTEKEMLTVHVGPTAYLKEKGIMLAKGDMLEVLGSRVTIDRQPVVIARQIKKGDSTWTLRDATGRPLWSGRGRR